MEDQVTVKALKYGDKLHYEWETTLLQKSDRHIVVLGEYGRKLQHHTKQKVFTVDNWTIEFFSFDLWFTVSADVVNGKIEQYYCNINKPAKMDGNVISFVDLDLDYVHRNGEWKVIDEDEFEHNAVKFGYPDDLIHNAKRELVSLQERIKNKQFPFDGTLENFIDCVPN